MRLKHGDCVPKDHIGSPNNVIGPSASTQGTILSDEPIPMSTQLMPNGYEMFKVNKVNKTFNAAIWP